MIKVTPACSSWNVTLSCVHIVSSITFLFFAFRTGVDNSVNDGILSRGAIIAREVILVCLETACLIILILSVIAVLQHFPNKVGPQKTKCCRRKLYQAIDEDKRLWSKLFVGFAVCFSFRLFMLLFMMIFAIYPGSELTIVAIINCVLSIISMLSIGIIMRNVK